MWIPPNFDQPQSEALIEELKHWEVTINDDEIAQLTLIQDS